MNTYHLSVQFPRAIPFNQESLEIIKEALEVSNSSFSANRYKRTIELDPKLIDEKHIHLIMKSRDEINPTRSLSSLSIAFYNKCKEKNPALLDKVSYNGCIFNAKVIQAPKQPITIKDLADDDALLLKSVVDLVYSKNEEQKQKLREFMLPIINDK